MNRLNQLPDPIIFAHRGASGHAPENTLAAFDLAVAQGADAVEFDVKLSKDEHVVVIHDSTLERTTNGCGNVKEHTLAELQALDAGLHFSPSFADQRIPTLGEVLALLGQRIYINIELTNYSTPLDSLPEKVAEIVRSHQLQNNVLFSSFNFITLYRIKRLLPEVPVAILALPGMAGALTRSFLLRALSPRVIHPHFADATPEYIRRQRKIGRRVHVWTVNQEHAMLNLIQSGVQGIFTDDPLLAKKCLERV